MLLMPSITGLPSQPRSPVICDRQRPTCSGDSRASDSYVTKWTTENSVIPGMYRKQSLSLSPAPHAPSPSAAVLACLSLVLVLPSSPPPPPMAHFPQKPTSPEGMGSLLVPCEPPVVRAPFRSPCYYRAADDRVHLFPCYHSSSALTTAE